MMSLHNEADLRDLWYEVNDSKSIVIYCGAGVTADRTGVGWLGLINRLFIIEGVGVVCGVRRVVAG